MRLYIDKENIESIITNRKDNLDKFSELARYVKKGLIVHYNFPKEEMLENQYLQAWFKTVKGEGVSSVSEFCPPSNVFPVRPVKTNFLSSCQPNALRSIYFLNMKQNISKVIQDKQCILISNVGEEYDSIEKLLTLEDKETLTSSILSWSSYCPQLPLTDIIICDEHYFKNKEVYDKNHNEIITSLCNTPKNQINVVIITKEGEVDPTIDINTECQNIKQQISVTSNISGKNCRVTVLTTYKTHSRHLITNYFRIVHTSCFHLKDNGLKGDVNTDIASHVNKNSNEVTDKLLVLFQTIVDSPVKCFGDKISNFLKF